MSAAVPATPPLVVAIRMGYGHLRPAHALAAHLGTEVLCVDEAPIASEDEKRLWSRIRRLYETTTRWSSLPFVGTPFSYVVTSATGIPPLHPYRDLSRATWSTRRMARAIRGGLGRTLVETMRGSERPLLTTYFAAAHAADAAGLENVFCVVTDSDIHRIWAPLDPARSRIQYLVPSMRARRRLRSYGVRGDHVHVTGYPLPSELLGGPKLGALKRNLASTLVRLDPEGVFRESYAHELELFLGPIPEEEEGRALRLSFAVGGAGAQIAVVARALPGLVAAVREGRLELTLVAGVRSGVARRFAALLARHGLATDVEVLHATDHGNYFTEFNALLARTDVLWTKPSEMTFFGALGLALVLSAPVGVHEWYNRRWARESGAALKQRDARFAGQWLREWHQDGLLAAAAWSGYMRLPKFGLYEIAGHLAGARAEDPAPERE